MSVGPHDLQTFMLTVGAELNFISPNSMSSPYPYKFVKKKKIKKKSSVQFIMISCLIFSLNNI